MYVYTWNSVFRYISVFSVYMFTPFRNSPFMGLILILCALLLPYLPLFWSEHCPGPPCLHIHLTSPHALHLPTLIMELTGSPETSLCFHHAKHSIAEDYHFHSQRHAIPQYQTRDSTWVILSQSQTSKLVYSILFSCSSYMNYITILESYYLTAASVYIGTR